VFGKNHISEMGKTTVLSRGKKSAREVWGGGGGGGRGAGVGGGGGGGWGKCVCYRGGRITRRRHKNTIVKI